MNRVGFNCARDFRLQGQQQAALGFLMYPYAETVEGASDPLDPDHFAYTISAKEVI